MINDILVVSIFNIPKSKYIIMGCYWGLLLQIVNLY